MTDTGPSSAGSDWRSELGALRDALVFSGESDRLALAELDQAVQETARELTRIGASLPAAGQGLKNSVAAVLAAAENLRAWQGVKSECAHLQISLGKLLDLEPLSGPVARATVCDWLTRVEWLALGLRTICVSPFDADDWQSHLAVAEESGVKTLRPLVEDLPSIRGTHIRSLIGLAASADDWSRLASSYRTALATAGDDPFNTSKRLISSLVEAVEAVKDACEALSPTATVIADKFPAKVERLAADSTVGSVAAAGVATCSFVRMTVAAAIHQLRRWIAGVRAEAASPVGGEHPFTERAEDARSLLRALDDEMTAALRFVEYLAICLHPMNDDESQRVLSARDKVESWWLPVREEVKGVLEDLPRSRNASAYSRSTPDNPPTQTPVPTMTGWSEGSYASSDAESENATEQDSGSTRHSVHDSQRLLDALTDMRSQLQHCIDVLLPRQGTRRAVQALHILSGSATKIITDLDGDAAVSTRAMEAMRLIPGCLDPATQAVLRYFRAVRSRRNPQLLGSLAPSFQECQFLADSLFRVASALDEAATQLPDTDFNDLSKHVLSTAGALHDGVSELSYAMPANGGALVRALDRANSRVIKAAIDGEVLDFILTSRDSWLFALTAALNTHGDAAAIAEAAEVIEGSEQTKGTVQVRKAGHKSPWTRLRRAVKGTPYHGEFRVTLDGPSNPADRRRISDALSQAHGGYGPSAKLVSFRDET